MRYKGNVYDSLVITKDEDYVMRRLSLSGYQVLKVLDKPIKEPLPDLNIQLFEGDNYIYLLDMSGNRLCAEYLIKNDFNNVYITRSEAHSAINETARAIELNVNEKLIEYSTTEEINALIQLLSQSILLEVAKKVDNQDYTSAKIMLLINDDTSEAKINADKISFEGKEVNLTADKMSVVSEGLNVNEKGKVTITDNSSGGIGEAFLEVLSSSNERDWITQVLAGVIKVKEYDFSDSGHFVNVSPFGISICKPNGEEMKYGIMMSVSSAGVALNIFNQNNSTKITPSEITTPKLTQGSLKSIKKNIKKLNTNATELIRNADICSYNLKSEKKGTKKHIGLVIGEGYNCPNEVISEDRKGVEQYSMTSVAWKAIQELIKKDEKKDKQIAELTQRLEKLEATINEKN